MMTKDLTLSQKKVQPGKEWMENTLSLIRTLWAGGGDKKEQKILSPWGKGAQILQSASPGGWHRSQEGKMGCLEKQVKEGKSRRNPTGVSRQMGTAAERTNLGQSRKSKNKLLSAAFHGCSVTKVPEDAGGNCLSVESTRQEAKSELLTGKTD